MPTAVIHILRLLAGVHEIVNCNVCCCCYVCFREFACLCNAENMRSLLLDRDKCQEEWEYQWRSERPDSSLCALSTQLNSNYFAENLLNSTSPLKSQDPRYHLQRRDQQSNERCDRDYSRTSKTFIHRLVCPAVERFRPHTAYTSSSRPRILVA